MEKYLIKLKPSESSTLELLEDSIEESTPFILGVIGHSSASYWNKETLYSTVVSPLLEQEEKKIDSILISNEGHSSLLLQAWADKTNVKATIYSADWKTLGRRARVLRDARILKESTHLLFFLGKVSDYYEKIAIREVKKGRVVYTVDPITHELVLWEL